MKCQQIFGHNSDDMSLFIHFCSIVGLEDCRITIIPQKSTSIQEGTRLRSSWKNHVAQLTTRICSERCRKDAEKGGLYFEQTYSNKQNALLMTDPLTVYFVGTIASLSWVDAYIQTFSVVLCIECTSSHIFSVLPFEANQVSCTIAIIITVTLTQFQKNAIFVCIPT